ncbi:MAG: hypothetical protein DDT42_01537 [candidate division WS2 bacterium]|uniref:DUF4221 domain-containing protein n=1 Tax=Psychracetigena formicireducens TaxID=2986056 RepID=A0A9E2F2H1_PSYF1|nr:hypothetical protein [Candidatus Psychracetigena formicireducens]
MDSLSPNLLPPPLQVIEENRLVHFNRRNNSLDIHNLQTGKLSQRITLAQEGEDGVGSISNYLWHNADSIFVINSYQYSVYLINQEGKVLRRYKLIDGKPGKHSSLPEIFPFELPPVLQEGELYIAAAPDADPSYKDYYQLNTLCIILNLKTGAYRHTYRYPKLYETGFFPHTQRMYDRTYIPEKQIFVYSFNGDEYLQVTDYKNLQKSILATSPEIPIIKPYKRSLNEEEMNKLSGKVEASFDAVKYDSYRQMLWRTAYRMEEVPGGDSKAHLYYIILDKELRKICELRSPLKGEIYIAIGMAFFTPEGVYLQRKKQPSEDKTVFDLLELKVQ